MPDLWTPPRAAQEPLEGLYSGNSVIVLPSQPCMHQSQESLLAPPGSRALQTQPHLTQWDTEHGDRSLSLSHQDRLWFTAESQSEGQSNAQEQAGLAQD